MTAYDSRPDTERHIARVRELLLLVELRLSHRAKEHDLSKLQEPEKSAFDELTPRLWESTYGSLEYEALRASMGEALAHHYAHNRHHPEHFPDGVLGMNLLDLVEMLCDWKAATERHADGDIRKSLVINAGRYKIPEPLARVLANTVEAMGW
jgi:hypothetical protein